MDKFTRIELEKICQFFNIAIEDYQEPDSTYKLRDKIQSMIDNYCEHNKDIVSLYTPTGDIPIAGYCYECNSCVDYKYINK